MSSLAIAYLQMQGMIELRDQIAELLDDEWPAFARQLRLVLEQLALLDDAQLLLMDDTQLQELVAVLMSLGLQSSARSMFISIRNQSSSGRKALDDRYRQRTVSRTLGPEREIGAVDLRSIGTALLAAITPQREREMYVNFTFSEVGYPTYRPLLLSEGLVSNRTYQLAVSISLEPDQRFSGTQTQPPLVQPPDTTETIDLYVAVFPRGVASDQLLSVVSAPLDTLDWPAYGPSRKAAEFVLETKDILDKRETVLDIYIYYRANLLYSAQLTVTIQPADTEWQLDRQPIFWVYRDTQIAQPPRLQRFEYIRALQPRALNLAIQKNDSQDEYILTALVGAVALPARLKITQEELSSHILEARKLLDDLRKQPVYIEGGYSNSGEYVGDYIGPTGGYTKLRRTMPKAETKEVFDRFMNEAMYLGSRFYDALFSSNPGFRAALVEHLQMTDRVQIWIDRDAHDFVYPWAWLYPELVNPARRVQVQKDLFWGYRYVLEQLPQYPETAGQLPLSSGISPDPLDVKIGVWNFEPTTRMQRDFFEQCSDSSNGSLQCEFWDKEGPWQTFLPQCSSQILYFFSHGHTAKPMTLATQYFYDMVSSIKQWTAISLPCESDGVREYRLRLIESLRELERDQNLLKETHIQLQHGYLQLRRLRQIMNLRQTAPLVFLNMCESAQIFPSIEEGLVDAFIRAGARGVIGTEIPMIDAFADLFARQFFEALFYQQTDAGTTMGVGDILRNLRRTFLDQGNPLGFAYTFFGDTTLHLDYALPVDSL